MHSVDVVSHVWAPVRHGCGVGNPVGANVGACVGAAVGVQEGLCVGAAVGLFVGDAVGLFVGDAVVGCSVGGAGRLHVMLVMYGSL